MTRLEPNTTTRGRGITASRRLLEPALVGVAVAEQRLAGREAGGGQLDPRLVARPIPDREAVDHRHQAEKERDDDDERPH